MDPWHMANASSRCTACAAMAGATPVTFNDLRDSLVDPPTSLGDRLW